MVGWAFLTVGGDLVYYVPKLTIAVGGDGHRVGGGIYFCCRPCHAILPV